MKAPSVPSLDARARALYDACQSVKPSWDQLGDITKSVWREYVINGTYEHRLQHLPTNQQHHHEPGAPARHTDHLPVPDEALGPVDHPPVLLRKRTRIDPPLPEGSISTIPQGSARVTTLIRRSRPKTVAKP